MPFSLPRSFEGKGSSASASERFVNHQVPDHFKSARDGSQRRSRIDGVCLCPHLADVPAIDIEIPQKGNARHDVKGNLPIGPLNDVLVLGTGHHGPSEYRSTGIWLHSLRSGFRNSPSPREGDSHWGTARSQ